MTAVAARSVAAIAVLAACAIARPAAAQGDAPDPHAAQPERPSVATHAGTVAPGWVEIESGVERDRLDMDSSWQASAVVKVGLARCVQLEIQAPLPLAPREAAGFGDLSIGVKWRLVDDDPILGDFAILPSLTLPTGDARGLGTGTTDEGLLLISSRKLGSVSMDLNAGYTWRSGDGTAVPRQAILWAASVGGPVHGVLGWGAEMSGSPATSGPAGADAVVALLGNITITIRPWLVIDAGASGAVAGQQARAVFAGLTYNIGRIEGR